MRANRYGDVMLTVIAVCLSALTLSQFDPPEARAGTSFSAQENQERREAISTGPHAPFSTKPLRWRIPFARHRNPTGVGTLDCVTAVSVVSFAPAQIQYDVEFLDYSGNSAGLVSRSLASGNGEIVASDSNTIEDPILVFASAGTGNFGGYVHVNATDPRIFVTALLRCGEDSQEIASSITTIPAFPVGATMEYFQAAMPATWTPPMAEVPE